MMIQRQRRDKIGFAIMEYLILLLILITSFFVFKTYFVRALAGKWKNAGDQFGAGRQFSPTDTVECAYDPVSLNWYDVTCYENKNCPPGNDSCQQQAINQCQNNFCKFDPRYDIN